MSDEQYPNLEQPHAHPHVETETTASGPSSFAAPNGSATCQHRMGHYRYSSSYVTGEEYVRCGKRATHVAEYPNRAPFFLCRKHAKTRCYVRELPNARISDETPRQ